MTKRYTYLDMLDSKDDSPVLTVVKTQLKRSYTYLDMLDSKDSPVNTPSKTIIDAESCSSDSKRVKSPPEADPSDGMDCSTTKVNTIVTQDHTYESDYLAVLMEKEEKERYDIQPSYNKNLQNMIHITWKHRTLAIAWIYYLHYQFLCSFDTVVHAVKLLDVFLQGRRGETTANLQKWAAVAYTLAHKMIMRDYHTEKTTMDTIKARKDRADLIRVGFILLCEYLPEEDVKDKNITPFMQNIKRVNELKVMEADFLRQINFRVERIHLHRFLEWYTGELDKLYPINDLVHEKRLRHGLLHLLTSVIMLTTHFQEFIPSAMASALIYVVITLTEGKLSIPSWIGIITTRSGYTPQEVKPCIELIVERYNWTKLELKQKEIYTDTMVEYVGDLFSIYTKTLYGKINIENIDRIAVLDPLGLY